MKKEIWKDIPGYEGFYQASNYGRIRSLDREVRGRYGNIAVKKGKILKPHKTIVCGKERWEAKLSKNGKRFYFVWARCIYSAFYGPIPEGMQVNHIDENPSNNCLENLNLMTPKENSNWGTHKARTGKGHEKAILQKDLSGNIVGDYKSISLAAKTIGVSQSLVSMYLSGRRKQEGYVWEFKKEAV